MAMKDKTFEANSLNELTDHGKKLYENGTPQKPINSNYGPIMNVPHAETSLALSTRMVKWKNKDETCHSNIIREYTHMQALTQDQNKIRKDK